MSTFYWKQHDTSPALQVTLTDLDTGAPPAGATLVGATVKFNMKASGSNTLQINRATATIVDTTGWIVAYSPVAGDTDAAGTFDAEFEVTFSDSRKQTFPDPGYIPVIITADLDNV